MTFTTLEIIRNLMENRVIELNEKIYDSFGTTGPDWIDVDKITGARDMVAERNRLSDAITDFDNHNFC